MKKGMFKLYTIDNGKINYSRYKYHNYENRAFLLIKVKLDTIDDKKSTTGGLNMTFVKRERFC